MKRDHSGTRRNVACGVALGGLAGNNAHGAGVLQAALDCGLRPDLVSCTSGQIHWLHRYLQARGGAPGEVSGVLEQQLEADIQELSPTGLEALDTALVALSGKSDVFRPALPELPLNVFANLLVAAGKILENAAADWRTLFSCYRELAKTLPAQTLVPLFPEAFFEAVSNDFNAVRDIGILFNSYDVRAGEEYVYLNEFARELLEVDYGERNRYRERTTYCPITPAAVREGLWIYEYGRPDGVNAIDGAYFRQLMLSELARAATIYVARPINSAWLGTFPSSWIGLQDLKTEVNFNGSYAGERDKIMLMNRLLEQGAFTPEVLASKCYQRVELVEIEIETQEDFFDYAHESREVFRQARRKALTAFSRAVSQPPPVRET